MFYYRYRPGSELSIKELIYDEMFFASASECNDPYEGRLFAIFNHDENCWHNLIKVALDPLPIETFGDLHKRLTEFFVSRSPVYLDKILSLSPEEFCTIGRDSNEILLLLVALPRIKKYIERYAPAKKYFVSFSKSSSNFLMWSHYANNHSGYCLIFRPIKGAIFQNPDWKRTGISYATPKSFSPRMSFSIDESFQIEDVEYSDAPKNVDAFMGFPDSVSKGKYSPEDIKQFQKEFNSSYLKKHLVWNYEEEARIILSSGIPWLAGEPLDIPVHQRLFHYNSTQLAGIIFGARMIANQRNRIRDIVKEKVDRWYSDPESDRVVSDFVILEAQLSESNRDVHVEPVEIYGGIRPITPKDNDFQRRYDDWKNGRAIHFYKGGGKRVTIE